MRIEPFLVSPLFFEAASKKWNKKEKKRTEKRLNPLEKTTTTKNISKKKRPQLLLMSGPELARSTGIAALEPLGIFLGGQDKNYPGGAFFDPLNLARSGGGGGGEDPGEELRLRVAEIKHGRLAMVAWLGFAAQALVGGEGSEGPLHDFVALF